MFPLGSFSRDFAGIVVALVLVSLLFLVWQWGTPRPLAALGAEVASPGSAVIEPPASPEASGSARAGGGTDMADLESCLVGQWMHSHEEDTPDAQVYRPADYPFPPARGRDGFEFRPDGELVYLGIARADGTEESTGRWTVEAPDRVRIEVQHERIEPFTLQVVSCDEETLKVRR
jgi:hypothetical protein